MGRIRTIKPEFFRHELLYEAEIASGLPLRVAFSGLLTVADREGRGRWKPRILKLDVLPFDNLDFEKVMLSLVEHGFIQRYQIGAESYWYIPTFSKHQAVNLREAQSRLPAPPIADLHVQSPERTCTHMRKPDSTCSPMQTRGEVEVEVEGKGKEGNGNGNGKVENRLHGALPSQRTVQAADDTGANDLVDQAKGIFLRIPLNDGNEYPVHIRAIQDWEREFPGANVRQELRSTRGYWLARPANQRLARHQIRQSLRKHLAKKQDDDFGVKGEE